ncbi:hypothetical protein WA026_005430 [Henosepilachna vigintioctopunctata]|uniref:Protein takeout-like n=1 Tax=Henosepilachna vigintioctopunctata TaxID=420089 RepID=A0AAW1U233_9CUCU
MKMNILIFVVFVCCVHARELPKFLQPFKCSTKKNVENCIVNNGNKAIPLVAEGIPDYKVPKMNPLLVPFAQLISTPTLGLNMTNVKIHNLGNMKLSHVKFNWQTNIFAFDLRCKSIKIEGEYSVNGKIMVLPMKGNGPFEIYLNDGMYNLTISGTISKRNGDKYFHIEETRMNYHFDNVKFQFNNLFDGNKQLGDEMNKFLNENWEPLLADFGPGISKTISSIIAGFMQVLLNQIPHSEIFLD